MSDQRYEHHVISALGGMKAGYSGSMRLDAFHEFITGPHDAADAALLTAEQAYRRVPWVRRGVNLLSFAVSHVPYSIMESEQDVTESSPITMRLLQLTQKSLEMRGRAYWLIERNRLGTRQTLRYIPARSVKVNVDTTTGIVGFIVQFSTGSKPIPLEDMVYFHLPNCDSETEADPAPIESVLESASLLYAANRVASKFYAGGMVGVSLISLPAQTSNDEITRIEGFFRRMATGIGKAFRALGVRATVDVKQVGQTIRDSRMPELVAEARDDVAVGLDIPPTVLDGKAASFATAASEWFGFITQTVLPRAELIAEVANEQYLSKIGQYMELHPELMEIMQSVQLEQAQAIVTLVGDPNVTMQPLISIEEARAMLGFPEREMENPTGEEMPETEDDEMKLRLSWQRAFRVSRRNGHGNGKGIVAPNAPDDDQRRERERRLQEIMERYLAEQFERIRARA